MRLRKYTLNNSSLFHHRSSHQRNFRRYLEKISLIPLILEGHRNVYLTLKAFNFMVLLVATVDTFVGLPRKHSNGATQKYRWRTTNMPTVKTASLPNARPTRQKNVHLCAVQRAKWRCMDARWTIIGQFVRQSWDMKFGWNIKDLRNNTHSHQLPQKKD